MASTFTTLGIEKMATGENAGTWGDKTNTNLDIVNTAISGYVEQAVTSGGTLALSITDGAATSTAQNAVIKLTGTITGNSIVTVPDSVEKIYIVTNGTSGAYTVQFKTASGTGVTFGVSEKTTKLLYSDGTNIVDAGFSGALDIEGRELVLDADGDTTITADTDDQIDIKIAGADDFQFTANTFTAQSGSSIVVPDGGLTFGSTAITSTAAELNILDGVTSTAAELNILDGVTSTAAELNALDGITAVVGELNALDLGSTAVGTAIASKAVILDSNKDYTGIRNLTLTGDLTVGGDDITMGTNTAGNLLVADGTNFNSIAVSSLSEISTAASDDVFIAIDTSGGGLKKIARSAVVAGLATDSAISNVVEDTTPQLGGNLDTNSANILIDDAHFIADENGNEQIIFQTTSSAVNQFDVTNAATGNPPSIKATGGDTNIDFNISAKGTGHVTVLGDTNSGAIQFNCEQNSHGQILKAQPHSATVTNVMLLPDGADSTLVSLVSTDTLTNKTLTTPKIAEIDSLSSGDITLDADGDINLDAGGADINFKDDGTKFGHVKQSSSNMYIQVETQDKDIHFRGNDNGSIFNAAIIDMSDAGTLVLNHDLNLTTDSAVINFGADSDTTLTHTDGTGLTLNSTNKLCFNDASQFIQGTSATVLSIGATDEIDLTATAVDLNGTLNVSGVATFQATPVFPDGSLALDDLDIDGGTDIGEAIVDADLFIIDNGAGGTNRKTTASRLVTYIDANSSAATVGKAIAMAIVFG
jgi:hypothetical protein